MRKLTGRVPEVRSRVSIGVVASRGPSGTCSGRRLKTSNSSSATFAEAGSEVVVSNTAYMQGRDGIEVIARAALVYTVENGQITRLRMFQERADALEAAGLEE
jgi:ketosteroid isomerase-like protein